MAPRLELGNYQGVVRYHGLPPSVADRIREYRPDSKVLGAWSGDAASQPVAIEILPPMEELPHVQTTLAWGEGSNGLRAAMRLVPNNATYAYGEKPEVKLHIQNVSEKPITLATQLWLSDIQMSAKDNLNADVGVGGTFYSGYTHCGRIALLPRQTVVLDAGNLGIAPTEEQADEIEHITNRKLVVPAGTYQLHLSGRFPGISVRDRKGKQVIPLDGDWRGTLTTGVRPIVIAATRKTKNVTSDDRPDEENR